MIPAKRIEIGVADDRKVPALGVGDVGFLKYCLLVPMLRKDLTSESQLMIENHLGINREPGSPEAIVYRGSIICNTKSFFLIMSRSSPIDYTKSINLTLRIVKIV